MRAICSACAGEWLRLGPQRCKLTRNARALGIRHLMPTDKPPSRMAVFCRDSGGAFRTVDASPTRSREARRACPPTNDVSSEFDVEQLFRLLPEDVVAIRDRFRADRRLGSALQARQLRIERDNLKEKLANTTGQLKRIGKQFDALSRQLSHGQQAVSASVRPLSSATNRTKNNKA